MGKVLEALQVKYLCNLNVFFSALLKVAFSHCIYVLFCLAAVHGLPFCVGSSSGVVPLFLGLGMLLLWC